MSQIDAGAVQDQRRQVVRLAAPAPSSTICRRSPRQCSLPSSWRTGWRRRRRSVRPIARRRRRREERHRPRRQIVWLRRLVARWLAASWPISWAITMQICSSFSAYSTTPRLTVIKPFGSEPALSELSRTRPETSSRIRRHSSRRRPWAAGARIRRERTAQGFEHFFIRHEAPHRRPTGPLHLGLSRAEIVPADRRQLMHGTRASADKACSRKSHERPTSHACALLFLEDETARRARYSEIASQAIGNGPGSPPTGRRRQAT